MMLLDVAVTPTRVSSSAAALSHIWRYAGQGHGSLFTSGLHSAPAVYRRGWQSAAVPGDCVAGKTRLHSDVRCLENDPASAIPPVNFIEERFPARPAVDSVLTGSDDFRCNDLQMRCVILKQRGVKTQLLVFIAVLLSETRYQCSQMPSPLSVQTAMLPASWVMITLLL